MNDLLFILQYLKNRFEYLGNFVEETAQYNDFDNDININLNIAIREMEECIRLVELSLKGISLI